MDDVLDKVNGVIRLHRLQNGCILVLDRVENDKKPNMIKIYKCLVHNRETCKCGIEFKHHRRIYKNYENNNLSLQTDEQVVEDVSEEIEGEEYFKGFDR